MMTPPPRIEVPYGPINRVKGVPPYCGCRTVGVDAGCDYSGCVLEWMANAHVTFLIYCRALFPPGLVALCSPVVMLNGGWGCSGVNGGTKRQ